MDDEKKVLSFSDAFEKKKKELESLVQKTVTNDPDESMDRSEALKSEIERRMLQAKIFREISNQMFLFEAEISYLRARIYLLTVLSVAMITSVLFLLGFLFSTR